MLGMLLILMFQAALGRSWYESYMMFPPQVGALWDHLKEGSLSGEDWRVFSTMMTAGFLHGDLTHWGSNMLYFWMFGSLLSGLIGRWSMLGVFLLTIFAGSACDAFLRSAEMVPSLGASGGVMGLEGAYLGLALRFHLPNPETWPLARPISPSQLVVFALIGLAFDFSGLWQGVGNTAYGAHLGGFLMGVLLTGLLLPLKKLPYPRR